MTVQMVLDGSQYFRQSQFYDRHQSSSLTVLRKRETITSKLCDRLHPDSSTILTIRDEVLPGG